MVGSGYHHSIYIHQRNTYYGGQQLPSLHLHPTKAYLLWGAAATITPSTSIKGILIMGGSGYHHSIYIQQKHTYYGGQQLPSLHLHPSKEYLLWWAAATITPSTSNKSILIMGGSSYHHSIYIQQRHTYHGGQQLPSLHLHPSKEYLLWGAAVTITPSTSNKSILIMVHVNQQYDV